MLKLRALTGKYHPQMKLLRLRNGEYEHFGSCYIKSTLNLDKIFKKLRSCWLSSFLCDRFILYSSCICPKGMLRRTLSIF